MLIKDAARQKMLVKSPTQRYIQKVIERIIRAANSFEEADELDRRDIEAMSFEQRVSGVERLRRVWFGENRAESRLERILERADLPSGAH